AEPTQPAATATVQPAAAAAVQPALAAHEDRAVMREVLKERRENPETPAQVRPIAVAPAATAAASAATSATASASAAATAPVNPPPGAPASQPLQVGMDSIAPNETVERPAAPARTKTGAVTAPPAATVRHEEGAALAAVSAAEDTYVPAPPHG